MEMLLFNFFTGKWESVSLMGIDRPFIKTDRQSALSLCILYTLARKENPSTMKISDLDRLISDSIVYSKRSFIESVYYAQRTQLVKVEGDNVTITKKGSDFFITYLGWRLVTDNPFIMEFIKIPAGQFITGHKYCPDSPMRKIYLDDYEIGKYPVTNREYAEFTGKPTDKPDHPVVNVSWYEAMKYCKWLSEKTNSTITLPTEAQFVKAARGGIWLDGVKSKKVKNPLPRRKYPWGNDEPTVELANYDSGDTTPVSMHYLGTSPYGCQGMAGNIWQWCLDWYSSEYYAEMPRKNPVNEVKGEFKTTLGGSWQINTVLDGAWRIKAASMAVGNRGNDAPSGCRLNLGFRCVRLKGN